MFAESSGRTNTSIRGDEAICQAAKQQLLKFKLYVGSCQLVIVRRVVKYTATLQPPALGHSATSNDCSKMGILISYLEWNWPKKLQKRLRNEIVA